MRRADWAADASGQGLAGLVRQARAPRTSSPSQDGGSSFFDSKEWPHQGPLPDGARYPGLRSYAGSLRRRGIHLTEAKVLMRARHADCAQPPDARYEMPWADAEELLLDIYARYPMRATVPDEEPEAPATADEPDTPSRNAPVDWTALLEGEPPEVEWCAEPLIEAGTLVALYSPPKAGKSLLLLDICAGLAAGRSVLGNPAREPVRVVYLDHENTLADLGERLRAMGYKAADLGDNLRYLSFPSLPALDTAAGGQALLALVEEHRPDLVVIDTLSRFVGGDENEAQTYADLYRHSLAGLKRLGVAVVRLDHAGKDMTKGQRGSSAKSADVDAVWRLAPGPGGTVELVRDISRNGHGADRVRLSRRTDPLRHLPAMTGYSSGGMFSAEAGPPPHLRGLVKALDDAGVPSSYGRNRVRLALPADWKVRNELLSEAIAWRKDRDQEEAAGPFGTPDDEDDR